MASRDRPAGLGRCRPRNIPVGCSLGRERERTVADRYRILGFVTTPVNVIRVQLKDWFQRREGLKKATRDRREKKQRSGDRLKGR